MVRCPGKSYIYLSVALIISFGYMFWSGAYYFPLENDHFNVFVDTSRVLFETDERFLSVALDTTFMRCLFYDLSPEDWRKFEELSSLLAPAYLRLGGNEADLVVFVPDTDSTDSFLFSERKNSSCVEGIPINDTLYITGEDWIKITDFAKRSNLSFIMDLNVLLRNKSEWNSSNSEMLIEFSKERDIPLDFQLGNEPDYFHSMFNVTLASKQLAKDYDKLNTILKKSGTYAKSKLIGPEVTRPLNVASSSMTYLKDFLTHTNSVDVASWHQYYLDGRTATLRDFLDPNTFDIFNRQIQKVITVVRQISPTLPIWLTETSTAHHGGAPGLSDRYAASFLWLDKLGLAARNGMGVVVRQSLLKNSYALIDPKFKPSSDFWISFFYKNLVGKEVLNVSFTGPSESADFIRIYGHCLSPKSKLKGDLVIFGMNLGDKTEELITSGIEINYPIYSFTFTPLVDQLLSKSICLNGKKLVYDRNTIYDLLDKPDSVHLPLTLPPHSIAFWVFDEKKKSVCKKKNHIKENEILKKG